MPVLEAPSSVALPHVAAEFDAATEARPGLTTIVVRPRCAIGTAGEIVVCASDNARNRLSVLPNGPQVDAPAEGLPKAEMRLNENAIIDVHAETARISGVPSNRMMVGVKIGF